jgi:sortase (surface protein transpeptidase)
VTFGSSAVSRLLIVVSGAAFGGAVVSTATALTTPPPQPSVHQLAPIDIAPAPNFGGPVTPGTPVPVKILIPSLKLSARVEPLGITRDYSLQAPAGVSDVGWYRLGASPGSPGDAIISGHRGYPGGIHAVFDVISRLRTGDAINIQLADRRTVRFAVDRVYSVPYRDIPAGFFATDGAPRLTLITCAGRFGTSELTYSDRLVVEAVMVAGTHQGDI